MNPILLIINTLRYGNGWGKPEPVYTMDNAQPVTDAIALLERLSVDEAGALYLKEDLQ